MSRWGVVVLCALLAGLRCDSMDGTVFSIEDTFRQCLISQSSMPLGQCFGVGAVSKLQSLDDNQEFELIDGLMLSRDQHQQEYRTAYNLADKDPADFRTWMDSLSNAFTARNVQWDLNGLYPGLTMRIAPSINAAQMLEFVLQPGHDSVHQLKEIGTGRLLARQFLLPFLLGFKFNVAAFIPILFGILALLAKKAIIISKIALIVSSAYGLGSLLLGGNGGNKFQQNYNQGGFNPGFGGHYNRYPESAEYHGLVYRGMQEGAQEDELKLYGNLQNVFEGKEAKKGRNFAWEDKKTKI